MVGITNTDLTQILIMARLPPSTTDFISPGSTSSSMASAPRGLVVPVTTDATYSIGPIILAFVIVGILVGVAMYLYMKQHHNEYSQGGGQMTVLITNNSQIPYVVTLSDGRKLSLAPDQSAKISVNHNQPITASGYNYDGTQVNHTYVVTNRRTRNIHITPSGFRTNITGNNNTQLVNDASYPVMFVERSNKGGRRWASDIVPPHGVTDGNFVGARTLWEVVHPTSEDSPISQVTVGGRPKRLVFDGNKLSAE